VAVVAVFRGLWPGLAAAVVSFLLVDYYFVPPVGTLTIASEQDLVNLGLFLGAGGLVGILASHRRRAQLEAQRLASQLQGVNADLIRLNREQAEAAELALQLAQSEQQIRALEQTERNRSDLLANVSHDLRTPLATILTASTTMLSPPQPGVDHQDELRAISGEARRLSALVGDMLDMARIEGNALELQLEPVQVGDAIEAAVSRLKRQSPQRDVEWDAHEAAVNVLADWGRMGQVFDNLLANADRFARPGTPVRIGVAFKPDGLISIRVSDLGPGVPEELRDRIFERFVKSPVSSNGQAGGGTGLGLAIVRGIVEAHGGSVVLEASGPTGTTFRFTLPHAETDA